MLNSHQDKEPVHGDLVLVNESGCSASDYPPSVKGNIAFIERGSCSFGDKSANAGRAGAVAAGKARELLSQSVFAN